MPQTIKWKCNLIKCRVCKDITLLGQDTCKCYKPEYIDLVTLTKTEPTLDEERQRLIDQMNRP